MAVTQMIGAHIQRREDPRLITGHGNYIDDMKLTGMLHMSVVRSPFAHARIRSIDVSAAATSPRSPRRVHGRDFKPVLAGGIPAAPAFVPDKKQVPDQYPIAEKEVCYQGEPVAVVLADDRYLADDAAQLVERRVRPAPRGHRPRRGDQAGEPDRARGRAGQHRLGRGVPRR